MNGSRQKSIVSVANDHYPISKFSLIRLLFLIVPLIVVACSTQKGLTITHNDCSTYTTITVPTEWLIEQIPISEVDKFFENHPSDCMNSLWQEIRAGIDPTKDEVWRFSSPDEYWLQLAGKGGYVVVRSGVPNKAIVTILN